jgi:hypothetical protein
VDNIDRAYLPGFLALGLNRNKQDCDGKKAANDGRNEWRRAD